MTKDPTPPEVAAARLAARQHGVISRAQALECSLSADTIYRMVRSGRWRRLLPAVYTPSGSPPSWRRDVMAACLWIPGACASHRSAAALFGLAAVNEGVIEITSECSARAVGELIVHRAPLATQDLTSVGCIPVTTPTRTVVDLASCLGAADLASALDDASRRNLTSAARIERYLDQRGSKGRRGAASLRRLLDERSGQRHTESVLEATFQEVIRRSRLPAPIPQYELLAGGKFVARIDFAYPAERVAIELDGYAHHSSVAVFRHDRRRANQLQALGWVVLRFTDDDLRHRRREIVEQVRDLLYTRRAQRG